MVIYILKNNLPLTRVVFCDTGLEFGEMYNYIKICFRKFKELKPDLKTDWIKPQKSFEEYFYTVRETGKRKGEIWGFPFMVGAWCNSRLKIKPLNKYFKKIGEHKRYVGIAFDEPERYKRLPQNCIAPLFDAKMTEKDCLEYIEKNNFFNPMYWKFERIGCYLCPKQNLNSLRSLRRHYPFMWEKLLRMDKDSPIPFKADGTTVQELEKRFRYEDINRRKDYYKGYSINVEPRLFNQSKQLSLF